MTQPPLDKKIHPVTGRQAKRQVRSASGDADALVADIDISAFLTTALSLSTSHCGYDLILIPSLDRT